MKVGDVAFVLLLLKKSILYKHEAMLTSDWHFALLKNKMGLIYILAMCEVSMQTQGFLFHNQLSYVND